MFIGRRRPLLGAAMIGGAGYVAGKRGQRAAFGEAEEEQRLDTAGELGEVMAIGPVQLLVIGFQNAEPHPELRAELERLHEQDAIRLVDLLFVRKHSDGTIEHLRHSDLSPDEAEEVGAFVGALVGAGAAGEEGALAGAAVGAETVAEQGHVLPDGIWYLDDVLAENEAAALALIEHRWAIPLRDQIIDAGGSLLADSWVHPLDLVSIGLVAAEDAERELSG